MKISADMWKQRQRALGLNEPWDCQCTLGKLRRLYAASRPDTCACLAASAAKENELQVYDFYRINDLIRTAKKWQGSLLSMFNSVSALQAGRSAGWSDAAWGDRNIDGICHLA